MLPHHLPVLSEFTFCFVKFVKISKTSSIPSRFRKKHIVNESNVFLHKICGFITLNNAVEISTPYKCILKKTNQKVLLRPRFHLLRIFLI